MGYDSGEVDLNYDGDTKFNDNEETEELQGTSARDDPILKQVVNFDEAIFAFRQALRGFELIGNKWVKNQFPLAGDLFISKAYAGLKSVMSQPSLLVDGDDTMLFQMLLENILNLIRVCYDSKTVYEEDFTQIYMMYSNCLEVWLQIVDGGRGKEDFKQMITGVYKMNEERDKSDPYSFSNMVKAIRR